MYLVLALLGGRYLRSTGRRLTWEVLALWASVYIAFGALDEWLQQFVGRTASVGDWLADLLGNSDVATKAPAAVVARDRLRLEELESRRQGIVAALGRTDD